MSEPLDPKLILSYPRRKVWRSLAAGRFRCFVQNFTKFPHQDTQSFRVRLVDNLFCYVFPRSRLLGVRDGLVALADCILHLNTPTLQILLFAIDLEKLTAFAPEGLRPENPLFRVHQKRKPSRNFSQEYRVSRNSRVACRHARVRYRTKRIGVLWRFCRRQPRAINATALAVSLFLVLIRIHR